MGSLTFQLNTTNEIEHHYDLIANYIYSDANGESPVSEFVMSFVGVQLTEKSVTDAITVSFV